MNNAKVWLVVPPAVGIPVFLGAVAVGSFAVHVAVLSHTSWYTDYLLGQPLGATATATTFAAADVSPNVTILLPDGTSARAVLQVDEAADAPPAQ